MAETQRAKKAIMSGEIHLLLEDNSHLLYFVYFERKIINWKHEKHWNIYYDSNNFFLLLRWEFVWLEHGLRVNIPACCSQFYSWLTV